MHFRIHVDLQVLLPDDRNDLKADISDRLKTRAKSPKHTDNELNIKRSPHFTVCLNNKSKTTFSKKANITMQVNAREKQ